METERFNMDWECNGLNQNLVQFHSLPIEEDVEPAASPRDYMRFGLTQRKREKNSKQDIIYLWITKLSAPGSQLDFSCVDAGWTISDMRYMLWFWVGILT
jgi:hypothetical protein